MYIKIDLSSQLIADLSNQIDVATSLVREAQSKHLTNIGKTQFAYDVYCEKDEVTFTVLMNFLSHGFAFAYCFCGLPRNKRCRHIEEALLFHQERSRYELEKFFGADLIAIEKVF